MIKNLCTAIVTRGFVDGTPGSRGRYHGLPPVHSRHYRHIEEVRVRHIEEVVNLDQRVELGLEERGRNRRRD